MRELVTERLRLRPLQSCDLADVVSLASDFRVARMLSDMPFPANSDVMAEWLAPRSGELRYAVLLDGTLIGSVGYFHTHRHGAELGYWLGPAYWGRGFALEAAAQVIEHGRDRDGIRTFTASYFIDNPGSGRILHKLGFQSVGRKRIFCPARRASVDAVLCALALGPAERVPHRMPAAWLGTLRYFARSMTGFGGKQPALKD